MNVLIMTPFLPYPIDSGGNRRTFSLLQHLEPHGVRFVLVVVTGDPVDPERVAALEAKLPHVKVVVLPFGNKRMDKAVYFGLTQVGLGAWCYRSLATQIREIARKHGVDIIQAEYTQVGRFLPKACKPSVIVALELRWQVLRREAGLESRGLPRLRKLIEYVLMRREELATFGRYQRVVCMSNYDQKLLASLRPRLRTAVVENGVDVDRYPWVGQAPEKPGLYYLAWFVNRQNCLALDFFLDAVWPRLEPQRPDLVVVGGDLDPNRQERLRRQQIPYLGFMDAEQQAATLRRRALMVPLLSGGGTRLKILEAMALGNPVVSTAIGIEGIEATPGEHFLLAETAEDFVHAVGRLLSSHDLWEKLSRQARRLVEEKYDWRSLAGKQLALYEGMLSETSAR